MNPNAVFSACPSPAFPLRGVAAPVKPLLPARICAFTEEQSSFPKNSQSDGIVQSDFSTIHFPLSTYLLLILTFLRTCSPQFS
jgi:hypothetical protein